MVQNKRDSYAPLIMDLSFVTTGGNDAKVPAHEVVQSITVEQQDGGSWTATVILFDKDGDALENLFLAGTRQIRFRWGWDNGGGIEQNPLYEGQIIQYTPEFLADGVIFTLEIVPRTVVRAILDKRSRSFPDTFSATQVFKQIADDRGWAQVEKKNARSTVEDSDGPLKRSLSMKDESDIKFIKEQVLKQAVNADGQPFSFFFDREGVVHFHSREFLKQIVAAEYIFARNSMGDVIRFAPTEATIFSVLHGGGNAEYSAVDSVEGTKTVITTRQTETFPKGKDTINRDETHVTDYGGGFFGALIGGAVDAVRSLQARIQLMSRTPEDLKRKAAHQFNALKKEAFKAELDVKGTHAVGVFDYVEVRYVKISNGQDHYLSGVFHVLSVKHEVSTSGWVTSMSLVRGGSKAPVLGATRRKGQKQGSVPTDDSTQSDVAAGRGSQIGTSATAPAARKAQKTIQS